MLTLIGSLIGFVGSAIPQLLAYFKQKADHKHEKEMFHLQVEAMKIQWTFKLQEVEARADIEESKVLHKRAEIKLTGWRMLDGLLQAYNSSVRPTITYAFTGFYGLIIYAKYQLAVAQHGISWNMVVNLWTEPDMALFATVISYWFGQRGMRYALDRFAPVQE